MSRTRALDLCAVAFCRFRGVTRHQKGRWEARIGQLTGRKYRCAALWCSAHFDDLNSCTPCYRRSFWCSYLGLFDTCVCAVLL